MASLAALFSSPLQVAVVTFGIAALLTALIVPLVRRLGLRFGLIDRPDPRKQHAVPKKKRGSIPL